MALNSGIQTYQILTNDDVVCIPSMLLAVLSKRKGGISIDADSGPLRYVLWCCDSICHQLFSFIQVGSGHAVEDAEYNLTLRSTQLIK